MIPPGYAILISAIVIIACLMLYARFFARSRKNSMHHSLEDSEPFETGEALAGETEVPDDVAGKIGAGSAKSSDDHLFVLPADSMGPELPVEPSGFRAVVDELDESEKGAEVVAKSSKRDGEEDSDYFDDLQEAAAGLAMLMRSSPVNKASSSNTKPVIFAPDEVEDSEADTPGSIVLPLADSVEEKTIEDARPESLAAPKDDEREEDVTAKIPADLFQEEREESDASAVSETIQIEAVETDSSAGVESLEEDHEITEPIYPADAEEIALRDVETLFDDSIELVESEFSDEEQAPDDSQAVAPIVEAASDHSNRSNRLRLLLGDEVGDTVDAIDEGLDELETLVVSIESSLASLDMSVLDDDDLISEAA